MVLRLLVMMMVLAAADGHAATAGTTYGTGLSDASRVPIAKLLAHPEDYLGQRVRVVGRVSDVCPMRGCWIDIAHKGSSPPLRFKVKDGEIVFPLEIKGRRVTAEGVLTRIDLDLEQTIAYLTHLAEERGEPFDPGGVRGPMVVYRLEGSGAVVH